VSATNTPKPRVVAMVGVVGHNFLNEVEVRRVRYINFDTLCFDSVPIKFPVGSITNLVSLISLFTKKTLLSAATVPFTKSVAAAIRR